ncbi:hypothetical protein V8C35DRAFT_167533 [Trichoderma chlorosporum]
MPNPSVSPFGGTMSAAPCRQTYQPLQPIDMLRSIINWNSWRLLIMANARFPRLVSHLDGYVQRSSLTPCTKKLRPGEACARLLNLESITSELLLPLWELGLRRFFSVSIQSRGCIPW